jgi:PhnB protein
MSTTFNRLPSAPGRGEREHLSPRIANLGLDRERHPFFLPRGTNRSPGEPSDGMQRSAPEGWHSITPRLVVEDPAKLVRFLKDAFGATGELLADSPLEVRIGDSIVLISGTGTRNPMLGFLYLYVDDVDATYHRALRAGATSLEEPENMPYGDRRATIKDPCGNQWQIATRVA